jgi:hypothetical protein
MEPGSPSISSELDNPDERYPDQQGWPLTSTIYDALARLTLCGCGLSGGKMLFNNRKQFHAGGLP